MNVAELIDELSKLPPDAAVMIARDEEGNGFQQVEVVDHSDVNDEGEPCHPDDANPDGPKVVVLWP